jgi:hypothetical protein
MTFLKLIIEVTIWCGKVPRSWNEARTILILKKGQDDDINNCKPSQSRTADAMPYRHMLDRKMFSRRKSKGVYVYRSTERLHQEDKWMQRTRHPPE